MLRGDEEGCFGSSNGGGDSSQSPDRRGKQGPVGRNRSEDTVKDIGIGSAATKLTDKILGRNTDDLADILKDIAAECGLSHIAHLRLAADKSPDSSLLTAVTTFPKEWQARYFMKQYIKIDPTIARGRTAVLPFDWETLERDDPAIINFFRDANRHNVGRNGISIPVRNRRNVNSMVSFTSDALRPAWETFKKQNMAGLQRLAALIELGHAGRFQIARAASSTLSSRGGMSHLDRARQNASGNRRHLGLEPDQRPDTSGHRAA